MIHADKRPAYYLAITILAATVTAACGGDTRVPVAIALAGLTALIACEVRSGSEAAFPRERDSAGVRIVEYGDIPAGR